MTAQISPEIPAETPANAGCCPDCHRVLAELRPYLPLLAKVAPLLDNPAARFRAGLRRKAGSNE